VELSELLDHVGHVLDDRSAMLNGSPDSLWSDEVLVRYFRKAEEIFCRKAWVLRDSTTAACCTITLVAGQKDYNLHASVLRVLSVTPADSDIDLVRVNYDTLRPRFDAQPSDHWDVNLQYTDTPGRPVWYATDIANRVLRVRPTPRAQDVADIGTLRLRVARMPLVALTAEDVDNEPEIPEEYHLDLVDYVAGMALSHANVDNDGKRDAKGFLGQFFSSVRSARGDLQEAHGAPAQFRFGGWANS
jgi:hypothetical protein